LLVVHKLSEQPPVVEVAVTRPAQIAKVLAAVGEPGEFVYYNDLVKELVRVHGGTTELWRHTVSKYFPMNGLATHRELVRWQKRRDRFNFVIIVRVDEHE
jgi:hypothetical protein